jgi:16S rRNA (cytosine967-C5)-methyltransferase
MPDIDLLALDQDAGRLQRVASNLDRLGLTARLKAIDACLITHWWDGMPFDRILLDAPCSASGVIRRHPDIKYLRKPGDIPALAAQQAALLRALWPTLAPGGRLLYATCSVLRQENEGVVLDFLRNQPDAVSLPLELSGGMACAVGIQLLPGQQEGDGFYYALLARRP